MSKKLKPLKKSDVQLSDAALGQVQELYHLIRQHELTTAALKDAVKDLVEQDSGIDLSAGGYDLNIKTGELLPHKDN